MRTFCLRIRWIILLLFFTVSCTHHPIEKPVAEKLPEPVKEQRMPVLHQVAGTSIENRPIKSLFIGNSGATIMVVAAIHGDECEGTSLVWRLAGYFYDHPELLEGKKLILMPEANPDGCFHHYRYNLNHVDLNRNFPSSNRSADRVSGQQSLSEPETIALAKTINQNKPQRIIALHQPLACIDHDGPAEELAKHIAQHSDLPLCKLGAKPGSLGSYAGVNMNIPVITIELAPSAKDVSPDMLWKQYADALISSVLYPVEAK
jgi:protein MpaA